MKYKRIISAICAVMIFSTCLTATVGAAELCKETDISVAAIQRIIAGISSADEKISEDMDYYKDGVLNINDASQLQRYLDGEAYELVFIPAESEQVTSEAESQSQAVETTGFTEAQSQTVEATELCEPQSEFIEATELQTEISETEPESTTGEETESTTAQSTEAAETTAKGSFEETAFPETTISELTVPETILEEATISETTAIETTVSETTVPETTKAEIIHPELDYTELELGLGEIHSLCSVTKVSGALTFYSDKPEIVSVSQKGVIFALSTGKATIFCVSENGETAKCRVKVLPAATRLWLDHTSLKLGIGESIKLTSSAPSGEAALHRSFFSDNSEVASVTSEGVIEAAGEGTAVITCKTDEGVSATCFVRVCAPASSLWLDFTSAEMGVGDIYKMSGHIPDGEAAYYLYYSSSDPSVLAVSKTDGTIEALSEGSAVISCKTENGLKADCYITVGKSATSLSLNKTSLTLGTGEQYKLESYVPVGECAIEKYYYSDNPSVAAVERNSGIITAKSEGVARINCTTKKGVRAYCMVTVRKMADKVILNRSSLVIGVTETFDFDSFAPDGCAAYYRSYYSENRKIACINESGGLLTAISPGTTRIYCQLSNGAKTYCDVTVKAAPRTVSLGSDRTMKVGQIISLSPNFSADAFSANLVYTSSDSSVAKIESAGYDGIKIRAMSQGTSTIGVKTFNGKTGSIKITVSGSEVKCIDISTWQGDNVDFKKLRASGIECVIMRAGFSQTKDKRFEKYYSDARAAGMKIGVYWYLYAGSVGGAQKEARACLSVLSGKHLDMPVYCDIEEEYIVNKKSASEVTQLARAFGEIIRSGGFRPGLYASASVLYHKINRSSLNGYSIWNAEWNGRSTEECDIWQYSDKGRVSGISGDVDLDLIMNLNIIE